MNITNNEKHIPTKSFYARVLADTNLYRVDIGEEEFRYGEEVLIKTEFGEDLGFISSFLFDDGESKKAFHSGAMIRYPTKEDKEVQIAQQDHGRHFKASITQMASELKLNMNITHVLVPVYGKTVVVYYLAKGRVDFRELLKKMRVEFKQKIIMRQISSEDRKKSFSADCRMPL